MTQVVTVAGLVALLALAGSARAEQATEPEGAAVQTPGSPSLDVDVRLGPRSFRFGSRVFGRGGYAGGAWLNGETRPDGFSLDGRIEHDGKAHNFKLDADIDAWVRRAVRWWGVTDL
jgi:hypothetical protein